MEAQRIHISPEVYEHRKARYETRINAMLDYVTNDTVCRSRMLLDYFGRETNITADNATPVSACAANQKFLNNRTGKRFVQKYAGYCPVNP